MYAPQAAEKDIRLRPGYVFSAGAVGTTLHDNESLYVAEVSHLSPMSRHPERSRETSCGPRSSRSDPKACEDTPEQWESSRSVSCGPMRESGLMLSCRSGSKPLPDILMAFICLRVCCGARKTRLILDIRCVVAGGAAFVLGSCMLCRAQHSGAN